MKKGYIYTGQGATHYIAAGDTGDLVLLLHQSGRSSRMFQELLTELSGDYFAVAIDLPGFGLSDEPADDVTIEDLADLCADVIAHFGKGPARVYGHHSGNKIAASLAVRHPDMVDSLILAGQSHSIIPNRQAREKAIDKFVRPYRTLAAIADPLVARVEKWSNAYRSIVAVWWRGGLFSSTDRDALIARNTTIDIIQSMDASGALYRANLDFDLEEAYRQIRVRTLVLEIITPEEDERLGRHASAVCALIPGSESAVIEHEDEDGVTLERKPEELAKAMRSFFSGS